MLAAHAVDQLLADVEAETGPAHAARHLRIGAVELLEDPLLLFRRDAEALVPHAEANEAVALLDARPRRWPPSGEYLIAFSTRLTSTCRTLSTVGGDLRARSSGASISIVTVGGACIARRLDDALDEVVGVERLRDSRSSRPASSWFASRISFTIRPRRSDSSAISETKRSRPASSSAKS